MEVRPCCIESDVEVWAAGGGSLDTFSSGGWSEGIAFLVDGRVVFGMKGWCVMFLYNVYLWLTPTSEEAEVFQTRRAWCADQAISRVMRDRGVSYAHYAWAVPHNEKIPCTERFTVRCPGVPLVVH